MRSLVRAPFVAVKRTFKVPSSRGRGWCCSAAARLQPPVAERPARTAPGFVRPCQSRVRGSRSGRARRSRAPRRRAASFFYADREHGRARRARWAARTPPKPSAPDPTNRSEARRPPPCAPQIGDREATRQLVSWACVHCGNLSINVLSPGGLCPLECLGAVFCRTSGLNMRPGFAR